MKSSKNPDTNSAAYPLLFLIFLVNVLIDKPQALLERVLLHYLNAKVLFLDHLPCINLL
jgi:hypothetical protein